jgi:hypothetical protein
VTSGPCVMGSVPSDCGFVGTMVLRNGGGDDKEDEEGRKVRKATYHSAWIPPAPPRAAP